MEVLKGLYIYGKIAWTLAFRKKAADAAAARITRVLDDYNYGRLACRRSG